MTDNLSGDFVRGAMWSIVLRWSLRLMGMLSTIIIARLLTPADYGLVAMATLVMGLIETFLDADAATALLRSPNVDADLVDSAFTLKVLQAVVIAALVAISAPFASRYFHEPRLAPVLWTYCFVTIGSGLSSVGPVLARRSLDWFLEVKVALFARVVTFAVTLTAALVLRNYWALVVGSIVGMLANLVAGYALHPYRPRFKLSRAAELFAFSQWMLVTSIGSFFARKLDGFVVGRVSSTADLGAYNVALELGSMITTELGGPLNRALLPVLANLHDDPARMQRALMKTLAAVNTVTLPAGIGLAMVSPHAIPVLLGPRWSAAIPLLAIFSVVGVIRFMTGPYATLLFTLGYSRMLAGIAWSELVVFGAAVAFFWSDVSGGSITGIADARVVSSLFIAGVWILLGVRFGLTLATFGRAVVRPLGATLLMAACIWLLPMDGLPHIIALGGEIIVGAVVYTAALSLSWIAAGKPDGLERMTLDKLAGIKSRVSNVIARKDRSSPN